MMVDKMRAGLLSRQEHKVAGGLVPHIKTNDGVQLYYEETGRGRRYCSSTNSAATI